MISASRVSVMPISVNMLDWAMKYALERQDQPQREQAQHERRGRGTGSG